MFFQRLAPPFRVLLAIVWAALLLPSAAALAQRFEQGLLWRVERGGVLAGHVFGTIHLAEPRVTRMPPEVTRALEQARSVSLEVALDPANLMTLASRMVYTDGRDLPSAAGAELYGRAAELAGRLGLPEPALRIFKPWAIAMLLSVPPQNPAEVLDALIESTAVAQGKAVHPLETVEEQVSVFEGLSEPDQVLLLARAVTEYEQLPVMIGRLVKAYLARDLAAMWRLSQESAGARPEDRRLNEALMQRLLDQRNGRMAERMQARLREGGAFVAVGAMHLYGDRGVLAELQRRGWRVARVY